MFNFIISFIIVYMVVRYIRIFLVTRYLRNLRTEIELMTFKEIEQGILDQWPLRLIRLTEVVTPSRMRKAINQFYLPVHSFFYKEYIMYGDKDLNET